MILADPDDYEFPHIDWHCKECGMVYCYAGYPPETRCAEGHGAGWRPEDEQVREYIDTLESLDPGDWLVVCGDGPAPLKGPVAWTGDGELTTESIHTPARTIRWDDDRDHPVIVFDKADDEYATFNSEVHHVQAVPAEDLSEPELTKEVRTPIDGIKHDAASHAGIDPETAEVEGVRLVDDELELTLSGDADA